MKDPLLKGIRNLGAMWLEFAGHHRQARKAGKGLREPFQVGWDQSREHLTKTYMETYQPTGDHLFAQISEAEVQVLFDRFGVRERLEPTRYPTRTPELISDVALKLARQGGGPASERSEEVFRPKQAQTF